MRQSRQIPGSRWFEIHVLSYSFNVNVSKGLIQTMMLIISKYKICIKTLFLFHGEGEVSRYVVVESLPRFPLSGMKRCASPMKGKLGMAPMVFHYVEAIKDIGRTLAYFCVARFTKEQPSASWMRLGRLMIRGLAHDPE